MKEGLLKLVDEAVAGGWAHRRACAVVGLADVRAHRWRARLRDVGTLVDRAPGGTAVHRLLDWEAAAVLELIAEWGPTDRSHRKLAHRGSYVGKVFVAPSTLRRVAEKRQLRLPEPARRNPVVRPPWPDWARWEPNSIWIWDATHFTRARRSVFAVVDVVSRYWVELHVSAEESSTQVQLLFADALEGQGLLGGLTPERLDLALDDPRRPILLAWSDNGPQMTSGSTREFMALMAIWQRHGRPHTPHRPGPHRELLRPPQGRVAAPGGDRRTRRARARAAPGADGVQHGAPPYWDRASHRRIGPLRHRHRGAGQAGRDPRRRLRRQPCPVPPPPAHAPQAAHRRLDQRAVAGGAHRIRVGSCLKGLDSFRCLGRLKVGG